MQTPPPVLRTGFGESIGGKIDKNSPVGRRLISTVFVLVNRAATTAALYCTHSKRTVVTEDDVKQALKYHAITFLSEAEYDTLEHDVNSMQTLVDRFVTEDMTSDEVTDTMCDEIEDAMSETSDEDEVTEHMCACSVCSGIRNVDWDAWTPVDPAESFIKHHIDHMLTR
jgi:hypothetical protein